MVAAMVQRFAICGVGRDRPGIVAALTGVLGRHAVNIEDSRATILRGQFTLMLVIAAPSGTDTGDLRAELDAAARAVGLEALLVLPIEQAAAPPEPSHIVTVYGADHPGIVHAVTATLASRGAGITDMQTKLSDAGPNPLYVLIMELALPRSADADKLAAALAGVAEEQGVDLTLRALEADAI